MWRGNARAICGRDFSRSDRTVATLVCKGMSWGMVFLVPFYGLENGDESPPEPFGELRDDGVAERAQSVHPAGNPINHSTHVGFNKPPLTCRNCGACGLPSCE